jgi:heme A synthase
MLHRSAAGFFVIAALAAAGFAASSGMTRVRGWAFAGAGLALLQVALGISNVLLRMPVPLREAHAANAAVTFIVFVVATSLATLDPLPAPSASAKGLSMRRAV